MKRFCLLTVVVIACAVLCGCGKYTSSYSALMFVQTNTSEKANMSFSSFKGTNVFTLQCDGEEGRKLKYTAEVEDGKITVFYDYDDTKTEWFTIDGDGELSGELENIPKGKVYIIVESDGKCKEGKLDFSIE